MSGKLLPNRKVAQGGRNKLHNAVLDYLQLRNATFELHERKEMTPFVNTLVSALWLIDGQQDQIKSIPGTLLPLLHNFIALMPPVSISDLTSLPKAFCFERRFSNRHKTLTSKDLFAMASSLKRIQGLSCLKRPEWKAVFDDVKQLTSAINGFAYFRAEPATLNMSTKEGMSTSSGSLLQNSGGQQLF